MSEKDTGGQAFPRAAAQLNVGYVAEQKGMTLRDYFAAKAMQGMLAYPGCDTRGSHHNNNTSQGVASMAYDYADAMLEARK